MSTAYIAGILNGLKLLLFLPVDHFITSSEIRRYFSEIKPGTLNAKLRKLKKEGLIEVRLKEKLERAGDDRQEYKLTKSGLANREELVAVGLRVLESRIKKISEIKDSSELNRKEKNVQEIIEEFLMDFAEECAGMVKDNILKDQQEILKRMLKSYSKSF